MIGSGPSNPGRWRFRASGDTRDDVRRGQLESFEYL